MHNERSFRESRTCSRGVVDGSSPHALTSKLTPPPRHHLLASGSPACMLPPTERSSSTIVFFSDLIGFLSEFIDLRSIFRLQ
jgi:hypothetical protein